MNDFKLLAVRPRKGCSKDILKNLKEDQYYFFDNDYEASEDDFIRKKDISYGHAHQNFFYKRKKGNSTSLNHVNIQAVVGKNGEGKSSLLDFLIRILNNFHYLIIPGSFNQLLFIEGLYGEIYFSLDENIYRIKFVNESRLCTFDRKKNDEIESMNILNEPEEDWKYKEILFFTLGINYSLYSWNTEHYKNEKASSDPSFYTDNGIAFGEQKNWLSRVFHKNDGYLTPIALHPYRNKGKIDVNNEEFLTRQRLLSLCINPKLNFDKISEEQNFTDFVIREKETDYILNILSSISYVIDPKTATDIYSFVIDNFKKHYSPLVNEDLIKTVDYFKNLPPNFLTNIHKINSFLKEKPLSGENQISNLPRNRSTLANDLNLKDLTEENHNTIVDFVAIFEEGLPYINDRILILSFYITEIHEIWKQIIYKNGINDIEKDEIEKCLNYLTYKTLSITNKYPKYKERLPFDVINIFSSKIVDYYHSLREVCNGCINSLLNDRSHITLKLFQTLNYVCNYNKVKYPHDYSKLFRDLKKDNLIKESFEIKIEKYTSVVQSLYESYSNKKENNTISIERFYLEFLPPPIFFVDLNIRNEEGQKTTFDSLSSGERQLINVTSSIIYHLKNIDSIDNSNENYELFSYNYINIVLDEIELYFHPDYQRQFISRLLFLLNQVHFSNVKSLNILMITHSPFILSDIPKNNVMFLEKGKQTYPMSENTFGANIHTLLQHGFFLNSVPIGEFAKSKINELFDILNQQTDLDTDLEKRILMVGEPFLKSQLLKKYHERITSKNVDSLIKRITELESIIYDRNK